MILLDHFREDKKRKAVRALIEESRVDQDYVVMLGLSSVLITLGLVVGELPIIIGGMIIAPLIFPLLALGAAVVTLSLKAGLRAFLASAFSAAFVILISYLATFFLEDVEFRGVSFLISLKPHPLSFLVAFISGFSAAYALASPKLSAVLPGVATAVSLVPPLSAAGIALQIVDKTLFFDVFSVFLLNALGIVLASVIVFFFYGFSKLSDEEEKLIAKENHE